MARLASVEKLGYYPTPPSSLARLTRLLSALSSTLIRLYDPCAGQGEALAHVATALKAFHATPVTYGVELSSPRAQLAAALLQHVIQADYETVKITSEAFSLLYLNPPYDLEAANDQHLRRNRLEYSFLRNNLGKLQLGGVLVFIVPQPIIAIPHVAKFLSAHLERISVYRFPPEEFEYFDQVVLLAHRRPRGVVEQATVERLRAWGAGLADLPELPATPAPDQLYTVPATLIPENKLIFQRAQLSAAELLALYQTQNAFQTDIWRNFTQPKPPSSFTPLIPLRPRHIAALISSGQIGTVRLPDPATSQQDFLAKGITTKVVISQEDDDPEQDASHRTTHVETEEYRTTIYQLYPDGRHFILDQLSQIESFLAAHTDHLAKIIDQRYSSLYRQPTAAEWQQVSALLPYKKLPGRTTAGLLDAQKHAAIACSRSARTYRWADLIGEMGTGKSCTALATIDLLNAYPAWVVAPTHTLENWQNEIRHTLPGATGIIIRTLADLQRFHANYRPGQKWIALFSIEGAKLGPGWRPATVLKRKRIYETQLDGSLTKALATFHCCPKCGATAWRAHDQDSNQALILEDEDNLSRRQYCSAPRRRWQGDPAGDNRKGQWLFSDLADVQDLDDIGRKQTETLRCGEPLFIFTGFRRWPLAKFIKKHLPGFFQGGIADEMHKAKGKATDAAIAYHHLVDSTQNIINLTGTYFGGYATDIFWLRYRIDPAIRAEYSYHDEQRWVQHFGRVKRLVSEEALYAADGSFSGTHRYLISANPLPGISPLIYRHLLATTIFLRIEDLGYQLPPYEEQTVFLDMTPAQQADYNRLNDTLLATIQEGRGPNADEYDRRASQALLPVWLQSCLARPNSGFRPETVLWKPPGAKQREPFTIAVPADTCPELAEGTPVEPALPNSLTPADDDWDDLALPAADTATRDSLDQFTHTQAQSITPLASSIINPKTKIEIPFRCPTVVTGLDLLPKERWLLDWAQAELAQQRKILLYVRQTASRDIQPRLVEVLRYGGLRGLILPAKVQAIKRERWIQSHLHLLDLLSTNPRRVETGLNLVQFASICFYEIEYSLYTLVQAMRRVWRLGQIKPVKVLFPLYRGTLEEQAFYLMATKMAAMLLLYGENAAGAFAGGSNDLDGNILQELARRITRGQLVQSNGITTLLTTNSSQISEWSAIAEPALTPSNHPVQRPLDPTTTPGCPQGPSPDTLFVTLNSPRDKRLHANGQLSLFS